MRQVVKSFFGGIYPAAKKKSTAESPIEVLPAPETVAISLWHCAGAEAKAVVAKGDRVLKGQVIGEAAPGISAPVHSSVSGEVKAVELRPHVSGRSVTAVVIENDGLDNWVEKTPHPDPIQLDRAEILAKIKAAGIVGMGGGGFPAAVKLSPPADAVIDFLIINGCECEPYLTADHRMMVEYPEDIVLGAQLMAKACGAKRVIIAVEDDKPEAIQALRQAAGSLEVVALPTRYPQGGEKQLIQTLTGREVPSGGLPYQAGSLVHNVGTAWATAKAVRDGEPSIATVVTVTGEPVAEPKNFMVPIGTTLAQLFEAAGGFVNGVGKVIVGGPLMGAAQFELDASVCKNLTGVIAFSEKEARLPSILPCIKCSRCVDVCPARLMPLRLEAFAMNKMWDEALEYGALDCIECGSCAYICPSKRPLVQYIVLAKQEILQAQKSS